MALEYYGLPLLVALTLIVRLRLLYESGTCLIMLKILLELIDIWDETIAYFIGTLALKVSQILWDSKFVTECLQPCIQF